MFNKLASTKNTALWFCLSILNTLTLANNSLVQIEQALHSLRLQILKISLLNILLIGYRYRLVRNYDLRSSDNEIGTFPFFSSAEYN